jgi:alkylation response protein AidB-like acyl-CoA dehydrogenase
MGLRGNHSSPIEAENVVIGDEARLGADGQGFDIMMGVVLPYFQLMNAAVSLGISESAIQSTTAHVTGTRYEHLNQTLADSPVNRAHLAKMKIRGDMLRTLLDDSLTALETGRADTMLRVLECKAAAGEIAIEVTDLAMRLCGGAAFRKEVGVERNFRDARLGGDGADARHALRIYRQDSYWPTALRIDQRYRSYTYRIGKVGTQTVYPAGRSVDLLCL